MNIQSQIPKTFNDLIAAGDKRQRHALRVVEPFLSAQSLAPGSLSEADLMAPYEALQLEYARSPIVENGKPLNAECAARRAVNSFVAAYNQLLDKTNVQSPRLAKLPGPRALRAEDQAAFLKAFGPQIEAFQEPRGLNEKEREVERRALHNCWSALKVKGIEPPSLRDFLLGHHIEIIKNALQTSHKKTGALVQACDVLRALAKFHNLGKSEKLLGTIRRKFEKKSGISNAALGRLKPLLEARGYFALVRKSAEAARLDRPVDLTIEKNLFAVQSAIYIVLALISPATFRTLRPAAFAGVPRRTEAGERPTLKNLKTGENLEKSLNPGFVPKILDQYYFALAAMGLPPTHLFADLQGSPRAGDDLIANSIEKLLERFGVEIQILELRDLAVGQMMMNGDPVQTMINACRISPRSFRDRYEGDFRNTINALKKS